MPKIFSLIDFFPNLEGIKIEDIAAQFDRKIQQNLLENILANKFLYPTVVPVTPDDAKFEATLLGQLIKLDKDRFYNPHINKIYIPESLLNRFPNLETAVWAFANAIQPVGITNILLKTETKSNRNLATYIRPSITANRGRVVITIQSEVANNQSKKYEINVGSFLVIPTSTRTIDLKLEADTVTFLGKNQLVTEVLGGDIGVIIDARLL